MKSSWTFQSCLPSCDEWWTPFSSFSRLSLLFLQLESQCKKCLNLKSTFDVKWKSYSSMKLKLIHFFTLYLLTGMMIHITVTILVNHWTQRRKFGLKSIGLLGDWAKKFPYLFKLLVFQDDDDESSWIEEWPAVKNAESLHWITIIQRVNPSDLLVCCETFSFPSKDRQWLKLDLQRRFFILFPTSLWTQDTLKLLEKEFFVSFLHKGSTITCYKHLLSMHTLKPMHQIYKYLRKGNLSS